MNGHPRSHGTGLAKTQAPGVGHWFLHALCCAGLVACAVPPMVASTGVYDPLPGNDNGNRAGQGETQRSALAWESLQSGAAQLVDFSAFAPPAGAANPEAVFEGTLSFRGDDGVSEFVELNTKMRGVYKNADRLPDFDFQFVQHGTHLIPATRGLVVTRHPTWNYILEPGRVWKESGDKQFTRAAIPFALQEKNANCTHNGVLSLAFDAQGQISRVAYQIASETCQYFNFNTWGLLKARYQPHKIASAPALRAAYEQEVAARMPVRPIAQLALDFPNAGVDVAKVASDQSAAALSAFGVVVNGVHYVGGCQTRSGTYPYCDVLSLPSYSMAKSIVGGIGLMRLEQKFPGTAAAIADWNSLPQCNGKQWADVTLLNLLDMSTGNYGSKDYSADEGSKHVLNSFFLVTQLEDKLASACSYPRQAEVGTTWVYHTSDTFLLGTLMNGIYKARAGADKDFYSDMLVPEVWKPLKLSPVTSTTVRTADKSAQPFTGWGLTLHRDDIVKLGEFLNASEGKLNGQQVLDKKLYDEALQRTASTGLQAGPADSRYLHSFWLWNAASDRKGPALCKNERWIPYLSGFGGIGLVLLPNNMVYYFVSDKHEYGFKSTLVELNKIQSLCG